MANYKRLFVILAALALSVNALGAPAFAEIPVDMASDEILGMELRLSELGYFTGESDDIYDAETRQALESFQQANGLEVTGTADSGTVERLNSADALSRQDYLKRFANAYDQMTPLEQGSTSGDVLVMQRKLKEYGYFAGEPDGAFGETTQQAVETFQMANGLPVTGVADGAVLMRLMADSPISWSTFLAEMSASRGSTGLNVYVLQGKLKQLGLFEGSCTGSFGEQTEQAVRRYQAQNGLEETGEADAVTWAALYAGGDDGAVPADALRIGDYGDQIRQLQERLNALGFFDHEISGEFGYTTETAVRLFQMANALSATGVIDADTLARLTGDTAASMLDGIVQARFQLMLDTADSDAQANIYQLAQSLLGAHFGEMDDELYLGFAFVQYICVAAGLPVTFPEDLIRMANRQVETIAAVEPGDIVAFQTASADTVSMLFGIGAGDSEVITTADSDGWAVLSYMDRVEGATVYCWDAEEASQP